MELDYIILRRTEPMVQLRRRAEREGFARLQTHTWQPDVDLLGQAISQGIVPKDAFSVTQERLTPAQATDVSQDDSVIAIPLGDAHESHRAIGCGGRRSGDERSEGVVPSESLGGAVMGAWLTARKGEDALQLITAYPRWGAQPRTANER